MRRRAALVVALLFLWPILGLSPHTSAQEPLPGDVEIDTAPVELDGQVLFRVRGSSSLPAETRAANIRGRLEAVAADRAIPPAALRVAEAEGLERILAGDRPIVAVTEADARLEQLTRSELAQIHLARIRQAIDQYRQARTPQALRRGLRDAAGATVAFVVGVLLLVGLSWWLHRLIERRAISVSSRAESRDQLAGIRALAMPGPQRLAGAFHQALHLTTAIAFLVILFQFLGFVFGRFPATRYLSNNLLALVIGPLTTMGNAAVRELPKLAFLAVLFVVVRIVLRVLRLIFDAIQRGVLRWPGFEPEWAQPTYKIVRFALIAFAVVVGYPYFPGSESAAFKGISLFVGVLLSLGSSSAIANLVAGYSLIYRRVFRVGDVVKIGDVIGEVTDSRIQVTRLSSLKNEEVIIPNSTILTTQVVNYSALARTKGLILHTEVGIGYETPWRQIEAMLIAAAERTTGILRRPAPFVLHNKLADFAVIYELNVYCAEPGTMLEVYTALHRHILDVFNEYGVQIMTPAYMADPAEPKIVPRDHWHAAPAVPISTVPDAVSR
jgi:small-conductance mechanosensitive channel